MPKKAVAFWLLAAAAAMLTSGVTSRRVNVGGKLGWSENVNYTEWASQNHFYVGDWLFFQYEKYRYNVLEVNMTNYENCNDREFITNITRGAGRDVFQLTEARPYYFLSAGGYCYHGLKLAINVTLVPAPAPSPDSDASPAAPAATSHRVLLLSSVAAALLEALYLVS